jgi:hypothetical protein
MTIVPLDDAIVDRRGHRRPSTLAALDERDRLMSEAVARFMLGESSRRAAHRLHVALMRYNSGAWRRERTSSTLPPHRCDRIEGHCWMILRARDHVPSVGTIRAADFIGLVVKNDRKAAPVKPRTLPCFPGFR